MLPTPAIWTDEFIPWTEHETEKAGRPNALVTLNGGTVEGRFIGGNLNTMQGIWGSEYMPQIKEGDILLIEDSLKSISDVERSFSLLKVNGVFDKIGGLIVGKHELFDDKGSGRKYYEVLMEVIGKPTFPILAEFDCCHTKPMLTMPIGCKVRLDADKKQVAILE
ncbi:Microcin C7 self-immunity protein MccF [compost metagenome]